MRILAPEEYSDLHDAAPVVMRGGWGYTTTYCKVAEQRDAAVWLDPARDVVVVQELGRPVVELSMGVIVEAEARAPFVSEYESPTARHWRVARQLAHESLVRAGLGRTPEREP